MVAALALVLLGCQSGKIPTVKNMDDRDVIQTLLLSCLKSPDGWKETSENPKYVVLRPEYRSWQYKTPAREEYADSLKSLIDSKVDEIARLKGKRYQSERAKAMEHLEAVKQLSPTASGPKTYTTPEIVPLKSLSWDKRVIITDRGSTFLLDPKDEKIDKRLGHVGLFGAFSPPSYSPDGSYCIVSFSFPWSMHSGIASYILKRTPSRWEIVYHDEIYFV